jgi:hypothetical protein
MPLDDPLLPLPLHILSPPHVSAVPSVYSPTSPTTLTTVLYGSYAHTVVIADITATSVFTPTLSVVGTSAAK